MLLPETTLLFKIFRLIKEEKPKKIKEYLKKNLAKNFVRKSTLLIKYVVFFASKKIIIIDYISTTAKQTIL